MTSKMRRKLVGSQTLLLTALLLGSVTSCFDDSYDLKKDIDMTINVGGEHLAFPIGNTEKVTLDKIIEIEEGDDLQTDANGAYHLLKSGEIDDITTEVKTVTVKATNTEIDPIEVANSTDFSGGNLTTETTNKKSKPIETSADDIDEAVKEIYSLETSTPINIILEKGGNMNLTGLDATVTIQFSPVMQIEGTDEENKISFQLDEEDLAEGSYVHTVNLTGFAFGDGNKGNGKTVLAVDVVKAIQKQREIKQGKVAIVTGDSLNKKKISDIIDKLYGGALIIEKAGKMNEKTVARLNKAMEKDTGELLIVLEEQRKPLDRLLSSNREFRRKFTSRLEIPIFINDELVTFGQTYAQENGYRIDEMGILALYSKIDSLQREDHAVTVAEVKEIMDEAIQHSQKASAKKLMKRVFGKNTDEADRILLSEKDFNI